MESLVYNILTLIPVIRYPLIFFVAIFEGPILMTFCGFLIRIGAVSFLPVYIVLILGDLAGDLLWYGIGLRFAHPFIKRFGRYFSMSEDLVKKVETIFRRRHNVILFLSKITMGFGFAVVILMVAGKIRVPLRQFLLMNILGQFIWTAVLLSVGYFFGTFYMSVNQELQTVSLVAFLICMSALLYGLGRFIREQRFENIL